MKKRVLSISFLFFFVATFICVAQDYQDVVYLKNGSIIKGSIIELIPDDYLDIRISSGRVHTIDMYDVERIVKERVRGESSMQNERRNNPNQYPSNARPSQNNNRSLQNDNRYSQNNNRVIQNDNRYNSRNSYDNYQYYDDSYYYPSNRVYFGLKGGVNISNMALEDLGNKAGIYGGFFLEFKFNSFAIQPELLFSMQGAKLSGFGYKWEWDYEYGYDWDVSYNVKYNNYYINVPLMAKYYVVDGFSIEMGAQLGFLLSAKVKMKVGSHVADEDYKSTLNDVDFALNFGASYQIPNSPFGLSVRYSLGITDLVKSEYTELGTDAGKNRVFQAGIFLKF